MGLRATGGGASSDLDHGASSARGDLNHRAGAQPPLLLEEAALSQMLSLSAPDTEVQCLRDCLWAPLPASASRSLLLVTNFLSDEFPQLVSLPRAASAPGAPDVPGSQPRGPARIVRPVSGLLLAALATAAATHHRVAAAARRLRSACCAARRVKAPMKASRKGAHEGVA